MMIPRSQAITLLRMVRAVQRRGESVRKIDEALRTLESGSTLPSGVGTGGEVLDELVEALRALSDDDWRLAIVLSSEGRPRRGEG